MPAGVSVYALDPPSSCVAGDYAHGEHFSAQRVAHTEQWALSEIFTEDEHMWHLRYNQETAEWSIAEFSRQIPLDPEPDWFHFLREAEYALAQRTASRTGTFWTEGDDRL